MKVTDETLLNSGFTPSDLQKMKNNVESYGGTLGNAIRIWPRVLFSLCGLYLVALLYSFSDDIRI